MRGYLKGGEKDTLSQTVMNDFLGCLPLSYRVTL